MRSVLLISTSTSSSIVITNPHDSPLSTKSRRTEYGTESLGSSLSDGPTPFSSGRGYVRCLLLFSFVVALSAVITFLFAVRREGGGGGGSDLFLASLRSDERTPTHGSASCCRRSLLLLRHAKSSRDDASLQDFDRPLAESGVKQAEQLGRYLMKHRREIAPPDTVVASPSVRTRQTIQLVLQEQAHWAESVKVEYQQDLFTDALDSYWNIIHHSLPDSSTRILLVGHNPALRELALQLTGSTDIMVKPATLLEFQWPFHLATWADIQPGTANLTLWLPPSIASQE